MAHLRRSFQVVVSIVHCCEREALCVLRVYVVGGMLFCPWNFLVEVVSLLFELKFPLCFVGWCNGLQSEVLASTRGLCAMYRVTRYANGSRMTIKMKTIVLV